ncbi:MAG TPA: hypothetical protein VFL36_21740 [Myxococcales bacterium]|nr:hypothetical protein [Myxococcales bacterium]
MSDRALLVCHAVLGFTAVFAATHHAAHAVLAALGRPQARALRRLGWIAAAAVLVQALSGLALYPAYRVRVRAADFDLHAPGVAQLFDLKEHLSALAIALVIGAALAGRRDEEPRWPLAAVSCTGAAFLWVATVIGLYVTARHPL